MTAMGISTDEMMGIFKTLGCRDVQMCAIATMVCQDLQASCKFAKFEQVYNPELNLIYFRCCQENDNRPEIIIPHNNRKNLDLLEFDEIQSTIGVNAAYITIACCAPNSGVIYYSAQTGFKDKDKS